jgi:uncharacterized protein (DUF58 family)
MAEATTTDFRSALALGQEAAARSGVEVAVSGRTLQGPAGTWAGRRVGSSVEFQEYREYQPGDDLRHIDWGVYARTDRLTIKRFREEVTPHLDLLIDGSRSMALAGTAKADATAALAALLLGAAVHSGLRPTPWLAQDECRPLTGEPEHWPLSLDGTASLVEVLRRRPPTWHSGGVRVVISDLLWPEAPAALLSPLSRGAAFVVLVQVLARRDQDPQGEESAQAVRLVDAESGLRQDAHLPTALVAYRRALADHGEAWRRAARGSGARLVTLVAEDFLEGLSTDAALRPLLAAGVLRYP